MPPEGLESSRPIPSRRHRLRTRVWSAGRLLVLGVALALTFGTFFLTGMRVANRAREVAIPDLRGLTMDEANLALADLGLVLRVDQRRADPKVPANRVLAQEPPPNSVLRRQRAVRIHVSEGQRDPVVPIVVGQVERTAEIVLADDKITVGSRAEIRTEAYPSDVVVGQDPPPTHHAATVALLVNRGETTGGYVMPDLIGAMGGRVVDVLRRRGFRVTVAAEVPYPGIPSGVVVRQTPQAGFQIGQGDTIVLEVSR